LEWIIDGRFVLHIIATDKWINTHTDLIQPFQNECISATPYEIEKISTLKTPTEIIVVAQMVNTAIPTLSNNQWYLGLDAVRDPGNMGTIIRTANWFGIQHILLSEDCVEVYNPKVVQASMGSLLRVQIATCHLPTVLQATQIPIYATHLQGNDIRTIGGLSPGILLMGNESKGISNELVALSTALLLIPKIGEAESLNVAVATGIICSKLLL
jgi:TrmH family RNA methyltransferase